MKIVGIIQCRTGSTRLPNKALMKLAGRPMIQRYIERCKRIKGLDELVLATTELPKDDILCEIAKVENIRIYRGSENDLVDRIYNCAIDYGADVIVRLCADNPLIEPTEVDMIIKKYIEDFNRDDKYHPWSGGLYSNTHNINDNGYPDGLGAEVYEIGQFGWIHKYVKSPEIREHPHKYYDEFNTHTITCPRAYSYPELKLDVNTQEEYDYVSAIYDKFGHNNFHFLDYAEDLCLQHGKT